MSLKNLLKDTQNQRRAALLLNANRRTSKSAYIHQTGEIPLRYENMGQQIQRTVDKYAMRIALKSGHEQVHLTFGEAYEEASALAAKLKELDMEQGQHLAIWAPNTKQWYITFLASALGGFPLVAINPALQKSELKYALEKAKVRTLLTMDSYGEFDFLSTLDNEGGNNLRVLMKTQKKKLERFINYDEWLKEKPSSVHVNNLMNKVGQQLPESPFSVQFTSGTTGQTKAALISHFNMVNEAVYLGRCLQLDEGAKSICLTVPMFHGFGLSVMATALNYGSTLCLPSPTFTAEASLLAIEQENCQVVVGTPTTFVDLINTQKRLQKNTDCLDVAAMCGAPCSPEVLTRMKQVFQVPHRCLAYGLSETTGAVLVNDGSESPDTSKLSGGKLLQHGEAKIVDDMGRTLKFGEVGELCVRGWFTMLEYFKDDVHTMKALDGNGWLKTGDQFVLERNGIARYQGRKTDVIISGGENIFPEEIEHFLDKHPCVLESQVIGVPHERLGEEICVYLRLKSDTKPLTLEDIQGFCRGQLAHSKVPAHLRIVEEFPKTCSGKIQKFKLKQIFETGK